MGEGTEIRRVSYESVSKKNLLQVLRESLPEGAQPTAWTPKIFGAIFVIVILIGALSFPFTGILGGNTKIAITIGYPLVFLELKLYDPEANPMNMINLIADLLIYIFLAYAIDIGINMFMHSKWVKSKEELKGVPQQYRLQKRDLQGLNPNI